MDKKQDELEIYRAVAAMSGDIMFRYTMDTDTMELYYGSAEISKYGSTIKDYLKLIKNTNILGITDENSTERYIQALTTGKPSNIECEIQLSNHTGNRKWYYVIGKTEYGEDNKPQYIMGKMRDIDEQKHNMQGISKDLQIDGISCILSKEILRKKLQEKCTEYKGQEGAGAIISVDNMRRFYNCKEKGVQEQIAVSIVQCMERIFDRSVVIGRLDYDEFAVVFFGGNVNNQFFPLLKELSEEISKINFPELKGVPITLSIGVFCGIYEEKKEDEFYKKARKALNVAKYYGKGNVIVYSDDLDDHFAIHSRHLKISREMSNIKFDHALIEKALDTMSGSGNIEEVIKDIFVEIGGRFDLDRIVVREMSSLERKMAITYNWINPKSPSVAGKLAQEKLVVYDILEKTYSNKDIIIVENIDEVDFEPEVVNKVKALGMKSFVHCIYSGDEKACGCIGFESYTSKRKWKKSEIKTFQLITKLISSFLLNMRSYEEMLLINKSYETHDALTGFYKSKVFLDRAIKYVEANPNQKLAIIYTEMSEFSKINDVYGYDVGDEILKAYSKILREKEKRFILGSRIKADCFIALILEYDTRGNKATAVFVDRLNKELTDFCNVNYKGLHIDLKGAILPVVDADIKKYIERVIDIVRN